MDLQKLAAFISFFLAGCATGGNHVANNATASRHLATLTEGHMPTTIVLKKKMKVRLMVVRGADYLGISNTSVQSDANVQHGKAIKQAVLDGSAYCNFDIYANSSFVESDEIPEGTTFYVWGQNANSYYLAEHPKTGNDSPYDFSVVLTINDGSFNFVDFDSEPVQKACGKVLEFNK